jgi:preprotein translocase subunit SecE
MKEVVQFFSEVRTELSRVVWPKFDEWLGSTVVVLVVVAAFAIYLGGIDFGISSLAHYIFELYGVR